MRECREVFRDSEKGLKIAKNFRLTAREEEGMKKIETLVMCILTILVYGSLIGIGLAAVMLTRTF